MNSSPINSPGQANHKGSKRILRFGSYWFSLIVQPILGITFVVGLAWLFGYAQRNYKWFNADTSVAESNEDENAQYACSMLCVFVGAPGRCPVCGMELQKIKSQGDPKDIYGVTIDPTARRLANIKTVTALNLPIDNEIETLGRITYDETTLATISAYIDGRIEELSIDYTGATIRKGDELAVLYSPDLYTDQVSLLQSKQALQKTSTNQRVNRANRRLYESTRQRLIELGLPESQINALELSGKPDSRVKIFAPTSGTVVGKLAEEGKYVTTGMPILKVADLSTVWLMLEMYSEDTRNLALGQVVTVEIQSQPGKTFSGKVSFIAPMVDSKTQTVNVRVAVPNDAGLIKIGDLGKAKLRSNRNLVDHFVVVPRESVLINGSHSIAYVETKPGRFEFRNVKIAEIMGDRISLSDGIEPGEQVVTSGAFMLDSTFNIQGRVSLIDPNRAVPQNQSQLAEAESEEQEIFTSFKDLSPEDRKLAKSQIICPVTKAKLGTMGMGTPIRIALAERDVMICCAGCETNLRRDTAKYLAILDNYASQNRPPSTQVTTTAPDSESELPQMELPKAESPETQLPQMDLPNAGSSTTELPQMELPQMELPQMELPQMEAPK